MLTKDLNNDKTWIIYVSKKTIQKLIAVCALFLNSVYPIYFTELREIWDRFIVRLKSKEFWLNGMTS